MPTETSQVIVLMGPTASGKTAVAAHLAYLSDGVVISGDSRQVFRGMDLGTGKDLDEYCVNGKRIPYYLIDICDAGEEYNIYRYQNDFLKLYKSLPSQQQKILCGGSGLYIESVLQHYSLSEVPEDPAFRASLTKTSTEELIERLKRYGPLHNSTDTSSRKRVIRALEIAAHSDNPKGVEAHHNEPDKSPIGRYRVFALDITREERRSRISSRLRARVEGGMLSEVEQLLQQGVSKQMLLQYGLEYKFLTLYLCGELPYEEMLKRLEIAIHQFAKRQMTWLRGMPKRGIPITWVKPEANPMQTAKKILQMGN